MMWCDKEKVFHAASGLNVYFMAVFPQEPYYKFNTTERLSTVEHRPFYGLYLLTQNSLFVPQKKVWINIAQF